MYYSLHCYRQVTMEGQNRLFHWHFPIVEVEQWGFNQIIYRNITKITLPITFVNPFIALATPYNDDKDVSGNYLAGFAIRNLTNTDFKINQADVGLYASWIAIGY